MQMRPLATFLFAAAMAAGPALARGSGPSAGHAGTAVSSEDPALKVVTGTVKEYEANKWLAVRTNDDRDETFQLDERDLKVRVDPAVKIGSKVRVTLRAESGGKSLTVEPLSEG